MSKYFHLVCVILAALSLTALFLIVLPAQQRPLASTQAAITQAAITVNTLQDEDYTDGDCSLREAIHAANDNIAVDACPAGDSVITDTITFSVNGTITLTGQLSVTAGGPLLIDGAGWVWISGGGSVRLFYVNTGADLTLDELILVDGSASEDGAGIYNLGTLTVQYSVMFNNRALDYAGGGIYNEGDMTITNVLLFINQAYCGGAIYNRGKMTLIDSDLGSNNATWGGGVCNHETGTLTILNSTLSGNEALNAGGIYSSGPVTITNSTLSGNSADDSGGGIRNHGLLTINNSTLNGNSASVGGGGGIYNDPGYGEAVLYSSIIANSLSGDNCAGDPIDDNGFNLEDTDRCGFYAETSLSNTDPMLGPLDANGGPTLTHAPLIGSPAIDTGDPLNCPAIDQRGVARPIDGDEDGTTICDIGSIEYYLRVNQLIVNTLEDEDNNDGDCSLREAIHAANENQNVDACMGMDWNITDLITFTVSGTIPLTGQLSVVDGGALIIDGAEKITISGEDNVRIFNLESADLTLDSLILTNGSADEGGGINNICCKLTLINSTLLDNGSTSEGGGIYNGNYDLTIINSTLLNNSAYLEGGGIYNFQGTVIITDSILSGNSASGIGGGGIFNMIGTLTITHSSLTNNSTPSFGSGGAIESDGVVTIVDSILAGNSSVGAGGAIHSDGILNITNSTLSGNSAIISGGGIANHSGGTLTLSNSTLVGNNAENGGGLYNIFGTLYLTNDTFSANAAVTHGGGIYNNDGTTIVNNSTLWGNTASQGGGGIYNEVGIVTVGVSIVANSPSGGNCAGEEISDFGYNLEDADTCGFDPENGSMPNTDPMLVPLQHNGGPTWTHALALASPAIDALEFNECPPTDQRGIPRPIDGDGDKVAACDIGSYESDQWLTLIPDFQSASAEPGATISYAIVISSFTSLTDTYTLSVGSHSWETILSTEMIGPLYGWNSQPFTVSVSIPLTATTGMTDTVLITATSLTYPTIFWGSTRVTTQAVVVQRKFYLPMVARTD